MPDTPAGSGYRTWAWERIPVECRRTIDGARYVLAMTEQGTALVRWHGPAGRDTAPVSEVAALLHAIVAVMDRPVGDPERERVREWKRDLLARIEAADPVGRPEQSAPAEARSLGC